ncbi:zinc knuckle CX2CX4HX4C containing protein [Tanacetum coccineum]|uniref:Zinc knuckle CX2CX4HX4C containing protein n=1 Tax=Tanacetum coccineum TaxID=301880 RepID=A0ABQ5I0Z0_9ASTR
MCDEDDVFYFKFTSVIGLEQVLEQGPWLIHNQLLMLTKWSPNLNLSKERVTKVLVWVKIHKVPMVAYCEDGLNLIGTKIGTPIMLDSFTSSMCTKPWGLLGFAPALIEVSVEKELKQVVTMAILIVDGEDTCPKRVVEPIKDHLEDQTDGFTTDDDDVLNVQENGESSGGNDPRDRRQLWADLGFHKNVVYGCPWDDDDVLNVQENGESSGGNDNLKDYGISSWNIRGLNHTPKQSEWTSNATLCEKGCRIIMGWNKDVIPVLVVMTPGIDDNYGLIWAFTKMLFMDVHGFCWAILMFLLTWKICLLVLQKLKSLKKPLRKLMHEQGNLHDRVKRLRVELDELQKALDLDPSNGVLRDKVAVYVSGNLVSDVFVSHYQAFLGTDLVCDELDTVGLFDKKVSEISNVNMMKPISNDEIKKAMFSIGDDKAPGPDGYTSAFFKKSGMWLDRSKILTNRIIDGIKEVVSDTKSTFVLGRRISDNILITQELMHNYHLVRGPPRCDFKVDIQKAYDTVDWGRVNLSDSFRYHNHYEELDIINVCFADDLFLFARGDMGLATIIMDSLNEFKNVSGLVPSIPKSMTVFCNVLNHVKISILNIMPFSEGNILVVSSFLIRGFIWCNGEYKRGKAKVAWDDICLPKKEGGLGLRSLDVFNLPLMSAYIWNIVSNKELLWVRWIHMYKLLGRTLWDVQPKGAMSWGWRKILQLQERVRPFFRVQIGNGLNTSLWYDMWCSISPLSRFCTPRDIAREGFSLQTHVADLMLNGVWNWPNAWLSKAPELGSINNC